jgi:hypothetical protein
MFDNGTQTVHGLPRTTLVNCHLTGLLIAFKNVSDEVIQVVSVSVIAINITIRFAAKGEASSRSLQSGSEVLKYFGNGIDLIVLLYLLDIQGVSDAVLLFLCLFFFCLSNQEMK